MRVRNQIMVSAVILILLLSACFPLFSDFSMKKTRSDILLEPGVKKNCRSTRGNINGTWGLGGSPYLVDTNMTVEAGEGLSVEPGVEIIFQGNYTFEVLGELSIEGNYSAYVNITSNNTVPNSSFSRISIGEAGVLNLSYANVSSIQGIVNNGSGVINSSIFNSCSLPITYHGSNTPELVSIMNTSFWASQVSDILLNNSNVSISDVYGSGQSGPSVQFQNAQSKLLDYKSFLVECYRDTGEVMEGADLIIENDTVTIYATSHYQGDDPQTDNEGRTSWINVLTNTSYQSGWENNTVYISIFYSDAGELNVSLDPVHLDTMLPFTIISYQSVLDVFSPEKPLSFELSQLNNTAFNISWEPSLTPDLADHEVFVNNGTGWLSAAIVSSPDNYTHYQSAEEDVNYQVKMRSLDDAGNPSENTTVINLLMADIEAPYVVDFGPTGLDVPRNEDIFIRFSETMDELSVKSFFTIYPTAHHTLTLTENGTLFRASPYQTMTHNTFFNIELASNATDISGNRLLENFTFNFTTVADWQAPVILSWEPTGNNVSRRPDIVIRFNESIDDESFMNGFSIYPDVDGTLFFEQNNKIVTFKPDSNLDYGTTYEVTLAGTISDTSGNAMGQLMTFNFTTVEAPDTTAPTITDWGPTGNNISIWSSISINFSEPMWIWSVYMSVNITPKGEFDFEAGLNGTLFHFHPQKALEGNTRYEVSVSPNAKDEGGNSLLSTFRFNFTTHESDPPLIESSWPSDNARDVPLFTTVVFTFNEPVTLSDSFKVTIAPEIGFNAILNGVNNSVTIIPNSTFEPLTRYTLTIKGVIDIFNNSMTKKVIHFYTGKEEVVENAPVVDRTSPLDGSKDVPLGTPFFVTFLGEISESDINDDNMILKENNSTRINGTLVFEDGFLLLFPLVNLKWDTDYTIIIFGILSHPNKIPMASPYYINFETKPELIVHHEFKMVDNTPLNGSTLDIDKDKIVIWFKFSTSIDKNLALQYISISPVVDFDLSVEDEGRRLVIDLLEDLEPSTTYIIALDSGLTDKNGTRLDSSFKLYIHTIKDDDTKVDDDESWFQSNKTKLLWVGLLVLLFLIFAFFMLRSGKKKDYSFGVPCPHCGESMLKDEAVCWACGEKIEDSDAVEMEELRCPTCDAIVAEEDKVCLSCGEEFEDEELDVLEKILKKRKKELESAQEAEDEDDVEDEDESSEGDEEDESIDEKVAEVEDENAELEGEIGDEESDGIEDEVDEIAAEDASDDEGEDEPEGVGITGSDQDRDEETIDAAAIEEESSDTESVEESESPSETSVESEDGDEEDDDLEDDFDEFDELLSDLEDF